MTNETLRLGSRGSDLAMWQARRVSAMVSERLGRPCEIVVIKTQGDRIQNVAFQKMEGKGFFTKELQEALLDRRVDLVVHSLKDLPTDEPAGLAVVAIPERASPADLLLARPGVRQADAGPLGLPPGTVLGTSSLRRAAQTLVLAPGLDIRALRGNVPTRVGKLRDGQYDAILVAAAGVRRLELDLAGLDAVELSPEVFLPAPGQGALAIETRADDSATADLAGLHDERVADCVTAERRLLDLLGGGCHMPLGCLAVHENGGIHLDAVLGRVDEALTHAELARAHHISADAEAAARLCFRTLDEALPGVAR